MFSFVPFFQRYLRDSLSPLYIVCSCSQVWVYLSLGDDLSTGVSGVLKSPGSSLAVRSCFRSVNDRFVCCGAPELGRGVCVYKSLLCLPDASSGLSLHAVHLCLLLPFLA